MATFLASVLLLLGTASALRTGYSSPSRLHTALRPAERAVDLAGFATMCRRSRAAVSMVAPRKRRGEPEEPPKPTPLAVLGEGVAAIGTATAQVAGAAIVVTVGAMFAAALALLAFTIMIPLGLIPLA